MNDIGMKYRLLSPDWCAIRLMNKEEAANAITAILTASDKADKYLFATRAMALILVEDERLWTGRAKSMGDWIQQIAPESWGECYTAMRVFRTLLPDIPFEHLREIKRCNLLEMASKLSTGVRKDPKVIEAAKTMTHDKFMAQVALDHPLQHLETKSPLETAITMAMAIEGCGRKAAENAVGELYISEYAVTYAQLEETLK